MTGGTPPRRPPTGDTRSLMEKMGGVGGGGSILANARASSVPVTAAAAVGASVETLTCPGCGAPRERGSESMECPYCGSRIR